MKLLTGFFVLFISFYVFGCGGAPSKQFVWHSSPNNPTVENDYFRAQIVPSSCTQWGCRGFALTLFNLTESNLELNWNKTLYVHNNQTSGGFMFEGVVYRERNNPKSPDIIFSKGVLRKEIFPNNLVDFSSGKYGGWRHQPLPEGENGVFVTISVNGREISEKVSLFLSRRML